MLLRENVYSVAVTFKMTDGVEQQIHSNFALSFNIPPRKLLRWFRRLQLWATGDWQLHQTTHPPMSHILCKVFWQNMKPLRWLSPLQPTFGALWLLALPKIKITFEREEISDHWWNSGKYNGTGDGDLENCVRFQGAYVEGDWGITVLCTMFLISCIFFHKCLYFSYYKAG